MKRKAKADPRGAELAFYRFSKQWYWEANLKAGMEDRIMVGLYNGDDGCQWEFSITEHDIMGGAVRVAIFDDALKGLRNPVIVQALLALQGCPSLAQAEVRLERAGILPRVEADRNGLGR